MARLAITAGAKNEEKNKAWLYTKYSFLLVQ